MLVNVADVVLKVAVLWLGGQNVLSAFAMTDSGALSDTEIINVFVVFRHGDRMPLRNEVLYYPNGPQNQTYYPFGYGALNNRGKRRAYRVGEYLRQRYDGFIDRVYNSSQVAVNSTNTERTKMSALAALAAMFPPAGDQVWNDALSWQPIPYDIQPRDGVDFLNCPRHRQRWYQIMSQNHELRGRLAKYAGLMQQLGDHAGITITNPVQVLFMREAILGQERYNISPPSWFTDLRAKIDDLVIFRLSTEFFNNELTKLSSGALLNSFLERSAAIISGSSTVPRLQILAAHEVTVAGMMAAARVFTPHIPWYGSTFSLELRRNVTSGEYGIAAVYAPTPEEAAVILPVRGCDGAMLCPYTTYLQLVSAVRITTAEVAVACNER